MEPHRPDSSPSRGGFCLLRHPNADVRTIAYITERPREGYRYEIVTPHGATEVTQDEFRRGVTELRDRLSVAPKWHSKIAGANTTAQKQAVLRLLAEALPCYELPTHRHAPDESRALATPDMEA